MDQPLSIYIRGGVYYFLIPKEILGLLKKYCLQSRLLQPE